MSRTYRRRERRKRATARKGTMAGCLGRRSRARARTLRVVRDAETVFRAAILAGVLSAEESKASWAGHYFYMFHDEDGAAWFKHRDTRAYVFMSARRAAAAETLVPQTLAPGILEPGTLEPGSGA